MPPQIHRGLGFGNREISEYMAENGVWLKSHFLLVLSPSLGDQNCTSFLLDKENRY